MLTWVATSLHPARRKQLPKLITANPTISRLIFKVVNHWWFVGLENFFQIWAYQTHSYAASNARQRCGLVHPKVQDIRVKLAIKVMKSTIITVYGHYEIGLPWRTDGATLPNNQNMALRRFYNLEHRLNKDPKTAERYIDLMEGLVRTGWPCSES